MAGLLVPSMRAPVRPGRPPTCPVSPSHRRPAESTNGVGAALMRVTQEPTGPPAGRRGVSAWQRAGARWTAWPVHADPAPAPWAGGRRPGRAAGTPPGGQARPGHEEGDRQREGDLRPAPPTDRRQPPAHTRRPRQRPTTQSHAPPLRVREGRVASGRGRRSGPMDRRRLPNLASGSGCTGRLGRDPRYALSGQVSSGCNRRRPFGAS
jgi:hypothetical protein